MCQKKEHVSNTRVTHDLHIYNTQNTYVLHACYIHVKCLLHTYKDIKIIVITINVRTSDTIVNTKLFLK